MQVLGIDGCRGGWLMAGVAAAGGWELALASETEDLLAALRRADLALIDIPIGLSEAGPHERACDRGARALLGRPRAASVFRPPCRAALAAPDYDQACSINRQLTGVRLSKQAWHIVPKIRTVDRLLAAHPGLRTRCREAHPELCFWALNGRRPMRHNKRTPAGFAERAMLLHRLDATLGDLVADSLQRFRRSAVARDDVLDALVLGLSACIGLRAGLQSVPDPPERGSSGLAMAIWYASALG
jgi:predicted RNase H-like nuclease